MNGFLSCHFNSGEKYDRCILGEKFGVLIPRKDEEFWKRKEFRRFCECEDVLKIYYRDLIINILRDIQIYRIKSC